MLWTNWKSGIGRHRGWRNQWELTQWGVGAVRNRVLKYFTKCPNFEYKQVFVCVFLSSCCRKSNHTIFVKWSQLLFAGPAILRYSWHWPFNHLLFVRLFVLQGLQEADWGGWGDCRPQPGQVPPDSDSAHVLGRGRWPHWTGSGQAQSSGHGQGQLTRPGKHSTNYVLSIDEG